MIANYREFDIIIANKDGKFQSFFKRSISQNGLNLLEQPFRYDEKGYPAVANFTSEEEALKETKKAIDDFFGDKIVDSYPSDFQAKQSFTELVAQELEKARRKHPQGMRSAHEAYGVILEEVDEFWDLVKAQKPSNADLLSELKQIATMCQRAAEDLKLV